MERVHPVHGTDTTLTVAQHYNTKRLNEPFYYVGIYLFSQKIISSTLKLKGPRLSLSTMPNIFLKL